MYIEQSLVVFKTTFQHLLIMKLKRFHAILLEVKDKVFFKEIGARHLFNGLPKSLTAEKHFIAVMPGYFNRSALLAEVFDTGETIPIEAYNFLIPFLGGGDLFFQAIL
jgi:hypothetical protein